MYISSTIIKITIKADIFSFKVVFLISKLIFDFPIFISFFIFLCYNGCGWRVTIPQTCFLFGKLYYNAENKQVDCDCYFFYFQHFFIFLCHYNLFTSFFDIIILYYFIILHYFRRLFTSFFDIIILYFILKVMTFL